MQLSWKQISVAQGNPYQKKESKSNKVIVKIFFPVNIWFLKEVAARGQYLHSGIDPIDWISETSSKVRHSFYSKGFSQLP